MVPLILGLAELSKYLYNCWLQAPCCEVERLKIQPRLLLGLLSNLLRKVLLSLLLKRTHALLLESWLADITFC